LSKKRLPYINGYKAFLTLKILKNEARLRYYLSSIITKFIYNATLGQLILVRNLLLNLRLISEYI